MAEANGPTPSEALFLSTQPAPTRPWESRGIGTPSRTSRVEERTRAAKEVADAATRRWLQSYARRFWLWLGVMFLLAVTYGFINRYILTSVIVQGRSMAPTLQDGERYLLDRWSYNYRKPERGDVVVLRDPGHRDLAIKRIVGMPGDTIHLTQGAVIVNGKRFIEPYLPRGMRTYTPDMQDQLVMLGESQYFVLGDNRAVSEDSRYYGPVSRQRLIGCLSQ